MNCLSRIIPIFTLFLLLTQAFAQKTDMSSTGAIKVYTLQECLSIADSTNLDILAAQSTIQGAEADKKAAMGAYFPQVNANMGYS